MSQQKSRPFQANLSGGCRIRNSWEGHFIISEYNLKTCPVFLNKWSKPMPTIVVLRLWYGYYGSWNWILTNLDMSLLGAFKFTMWVGRLWETIKGVGCRPLFGRGGLAVSRHAQWIFNSLILELWIAISSSHGYFREKNTLFLWWS